jgi:hypothetical protein
MKGLLRSFLVFQCEFSLIKSILSLKYISTKHPLTNDATCFSQINGNSGRVTRSVERHQNIK